MKCHGDTRDGVITLGEERPNWGRTTGTELEGDRGGMQGAGGATGLQATGSMGAGQVLLT